MNIKFTFFLLLITIATAACQTPQFSGGQTSETDVKVVTSFYPLSYLTSEIASQNENVEVLNLIPSGMEPHDYEPNPSQVIQMMEADLLIVLGGGFEPWLEDLKEELSQSGTALLEINPRISRAGYDPHTWLDPVLVSDMTIMIEDSLSRMDATNVASYHSSAEQLRSQLNELHEQLSLGLSQCKHDSFITAHNAFTYFAERYGLELHPVSGISPMDEPSANQIADLVELAKTEGIQHIFLEELEDPTTAEVIKNEANLTSLMLNTMERQSSSQDDYFTLMQDNLENLKIGLACE